MKQMISVKEALAFITDNTRPLPPVSIPLKDANGLVIAEAIYAPIDIPAYPQSGMDGYAFAFEEGRTTYQLSGEVPAGDSRSIEIAKGTAIRIFTGAPVPPGADTVVMQEKTKVVDGTLYIQDENIRMGLNLRPKAAEIKKDSLAIKNGTKLQPVIIGFLAGLGINHVLVYPRPRVGVLVTGNELQSPGQPLSYGQVYDSNSYSLKAALNQLYINEILFRQSSDNIEQLKTQLAELLECSDLVLMVGGVSVGDYDFTLKAFEHCGVDPIFHKIKQKPGKPLLFGKKGAQLVFGLPGNPASVMTCFYNYVLPAIGILSQTNSALKTLIVPVKGDFQKPAGLSHFLKAYFDGTEVSIELGQESYKLSSFVRSNCLLYLEEETTVVKAGSIVTIYLLPE